ncbi:MAG TPA: response regulator transcription factor [Candidatus Limnocylindrales bacterium]|nr:response regulator transcription factor [Candidatus Limnocylindrales bacterium]
MIRVLIGQRGKLVREAIATVLSTPPDMTVVADLGHADEADRAVQRQAVDIAILDAKLPGATTVNDLCEKLIRQCGVLILTDPDCGDGACFSLTRHVPRVGFIATESSPDLLIESVRRAARGEPVFDTKLTMAALNARHNPLTGRERDVLCLAARGLRSIDIAQQLYISNGTVRNHLSRILTKTDCRTRIAAIRLAQEKGWI